MNKARLKQIIRQLKDITSELESEVYSNPAAYHISRDSELSYSDTNDEDGLCD